jgi:hypothetical protein
MAVAPSAAAPTEVEVDGATASYAFDPEVGVPYVASVQAVYADGAAPTSNASASVALSSEEPTTTATDGIEDAAPAGEVAPANESGTLPTTGRDLLWPITIALVFIAAGITLAAASRRSRRHVGGDPPAR